MEQIEERKRAAMKKNKKKGRVRRSIREIVPIWAYDTDLQCFQLKDDTYLDLLQIQSKDLVNASEDEVAFDCLKFAKLYRLYAGDIKIICLNFPCDYNNQKRFLEHKLKQTKNEIFKEQLNRKLQELIWLEKNDTTREYYYMIFAGTREELEKNRNVFFSTLGQGRVGLIQKISEIKKVEILFRLCNSTNLIHG